MQLDYLSYCVLFHGSETIFSVSKTRGDKFGKKINRWKSLCVAVIFVYFHLLHSDQILFSKSDLSCLEGDCMFGMQD